MGIKLSERPLPTQVERLLPQNDFIVSKTDLQGKITYVNKVFIDISGYSETDLLGTPHSIVRHPDMPKAAFKDLWDTVQQDKEWRGIVKNLCKDGAFYWVDAYVVPIFKNGKKTGYTSMRRSVSPAEIQKVVPLYAQWLREEA